MTILLDIDGVLVTTPPWKKVELLTDGFMKFNERATKCLSTLTQATNTSILLTTSHNLSYSTTEWKTIFSSRGIHCKEISRLGDVIESDNSKDRAELIQKWYDTCSTNHFFLIIDDDSSLHRLPNHIKQHWIQTKFLIGFDEKCLSLAEEFIRKNDTNPN